MRTMSRHRPASSPVPAASPRRVEAGPWLIELLPGAPYQARYVAAQAAIGFAFDSQRGVHAIGSDRVQPFTATPNGLAFVPCGCDVYSQSPAGGEYLRMVRVDGAPLAAAPAFNNVVDRPAIALAHRLRHALLQPSPLDDCEHWALALAQRAAGEPGPGPLDRGSITSKRLRLLDDYIDAHLDQPLSVQTLAALLQLSEGHFSRAFRQVTGQSPHGYLIDRRIAHARRLLHDTLQGLADIAQVCGFASHAHLTAAFRQRLGVAPSVLRGG